MSDKSGPYPDCWKRGCEFKGFYKEGAQLAPPPPTPARTCLGIRLKMTTREKVWFLLTQGLDSHIKKKE